MFVVRKEMMLKLVLFKNIDRRVGDAMSGNSYTKCNEWAIYLFIVIVQTHSYTCVYKLT